MEDLSLLVYQFLSLEALHCDILTLCSAATAHAQLSSFVTYLPLSCVTRFSVSSPTLLILIKIKPITTLIVSIVMVLLVIHHHLPSIHYVGIM